MLNFKLKSFDDKELNCYLFEVENPIGIVQIIHGMKEYSDRYFDFIKFLNNNGYNVFISDLRGHGLTSDSVENLGYVDGDIFDLCYRDQLYISDYLAEKYDNSDLFVIGHSFGSFLTQRYILSNVHAKKIILSGSAYNDTILFQSAKILSNIIVFFRGKRRDALFIEKLSFGAYGKKFENGNWLTRDENIFNAYNESPYCGTVFPNNFYQSMFKNSPKSYKGLKTLNIKPKIFIASGNDDPVGEFGKSVKKLYSVYKDAGLDVEMKLYPDCRHEILNELNKDEVYSDFLNYLQK